jgi:hypothetical protein
MIKLKGCNNLGPRRYKILECRLCGAVYAIRNTYINDYISEPWQRTASEEITHCETCGQYLKEKSLGSEKEYIELMKPHLEIYGHSSDGRWLMSEMYTKIENYDSLDELEETE